MKTETYNPTGLTHMIIKIGNLDLTNLTGRKVIARNTVKIHYNINMNEVVDTELFAVDNESSLEVLRSTLTIEIAGKSYTLLHDHVTQYRNDLVIGTTEYYHMPLSTRDEWSAMEHLTGEYQTCTTLYKLGTKECLFDVAQTMMVSV